MNRSKFLIASSSLLVSGCSAAGASRQIGANLLPDASVCPNSGVTGWEAPSRIALARAAAIGGCGGGVGGGYSLYRQNSDGSTWYRKQLSSTSGATAAYDSSGSLIGNHKADSDGRGILISMTSRVPLTNGSVSQTDFSSLPDPTRNFVTPGANVTVTGSNGTATAYLNSDGVSGTIVGTSGSTQFVFTFSVSASNNLTISTGGYSASYQISSPINISSNQARVQGLSRSRVVPQGLSRGQVMAILEAGAVLGGAVAGALALTTPIGWGAAIAITLAGSCSVAFGALDAAEHWVKAN
jgi:hypothetical protein